MRSLFFILFCFAAFFIIRSYLRHRLAQALRENPPDRKVIEIALPHGVSDSHKRMKPFYRAISAATAGDPQARKAGQRQVDIVYWVDYPQGSREPEIRFLIYSDPDQIEKIKRAMKNAFESMSSIVEPPDDPMADLAASLRPPRQNTPSPEGM